MLVAWYLLLFFISQMLAFLCNLFFELVTNTKLLFNTDACTFSDSLRQIYATLQHTLKYNKKLPDLPPRSKSSLRGSGGGLSSPLPGFPRRWGGKYRLFPPLEDDRSFSTPRPAS